MLSIRWRISRSTPLQRTSNSPQPMRCTNSCAHFAAHWPPLPIPRRPKTLNEDSPSTNENIIVWNRTYGPKLLIIVMIWSGDKMVTTPRPLSLGAAEHGAGIIRRNNPWEILFDAALVAIGERRFIQLKWSILVPSSNFEVACVLGGWYIWPCWSFDSFVLPRKYRWNPWQGL